MKKYRDWGAIGALLDEYEKAIDELKEVIKPLNHHQLTVIVDHETNDEDCRSIQTILEHVISSGYNYIIYSRKHIGESLEKKSSERLATIEEYSQSLDQMFDYNEQFFKDHPDVELNERENSKNFVSPWGPIYTLETLMEHAIVHVLRHRRQIRRFLIRMDDL